MAKTGAIAARPATANVNIEQRITRDLTVVASYFHNQGRINTDGANTALPELRGDPNITLPAPAGDAAPDAVVEDKPNKKKATNKLIIQSRHAKK